MNLEIVKAPTKPPRNKPRYHDTVFLGRGSARALRRHPELRTLDKAGKPILVKNPMPRPGALLAFREFGAAVDVPPQRIYRVGQGGNLRANGVTASAVEILMARPFPRARLSRRCSDRSKFSPRDTGANP